jgi:hypothetical protein
MPKYAFIDGERIRKAPTVRRIDPIFQDLAMGLARIPELRYIKLFAERSPGPTTRPLIPGYP